MSMLASARGAKHNHASRLRPAAVAAVLVLGIGLSGCANYETSKPYQPAAGVVTDAPGMKVRSLMLIEDGSTMHLAGTLLPDADDSLTKITGVALKADGSEGSALTVKAPATTKLSPEDGTELYPLGITATGDVKAGGMAKLTLTFAKNSPVTLEIPVVNAKDIDVDTTMPSASTSAK